MVAVTAELDIPVKFKGVSIGKTTVKLSMDVDRKMMRIGRADKTFCDRRLTGTLFLGGAGDSPAQTKMFDTDMQITGTFDVHRFAVTGELFSTGVTFKLKEIELEHLIKFRNCDGRLVVEEVGDIPADVVEEKPAASHLAGQFKVEGNWRKASLDNIFDGQILKSLKGHGLETVGDFHDFQQPKANGFIPKLTDISGIGESKVSTIGEIMMNFWRDNPDASENEPKKATKKPIAKKKTTRKKTAAK